jgi:hypothetical protein
MPPLTTGLNQIREKPVVLRAPAEVRVISRADYYSYSDHLFYFVSCCQACFDFFHRFSNI